MTEANGNIQLPPEPVVALQILVSPTGQVSFGGNVSNIAMAIYAIELLKANLLSQVQAKHGPQLVQANGHIPGLRG